jgi:hypothetical protein
MFAQLCQQLEAARLEKRADSVLSRHPLQEYKWALRELGNIFQRAGARPEGARKRQLLKAMTVGNLPR